MEKKDTIRIPEVPRERILGHAVDRFRSEGFARVSVDDLCADLAMSKKTFYKFFESKEALVEAIAGAIMSDIEQGVKKIIYGDIPYVEKVRQMMALMGERFRRLDKLFMQDIQRQTPHLWARIQSFRREKVLKNFADLIAEGKVLGTIRPQVNPRVFLLAYIGAIESVLVPDVLTDESFSAEEALRSILTIFFNGVLTDDAGRELDRLQQSQH